MKRALALTGGYFESSCFRTPEYLSWHRTFKRAFTKFLTERSITDIEFSKPNHFDMSGFFRAPNRQLYYFRISDIRWSKKDMLVRTAQHNKDWTGGHNHFVPLLAGEKIFTTRFDNLVIPKDCYANSTLI